MGAEGGGSGLSAAKARTVSRRFKKPRLIEPAAKYTVYEGNTQHVGTFKTIAALCPTVAPTTLKKRLEKGERDLTILRRKPQPIRGKSAFQRYNPKPIPRG